MTRLFDQQSFGSGGSNLWIGQVVDDSTWRDNVNPKLHEKPEDIKGWGYRYKVRIFGNQTKIKTDEEVPDELLAMAEVVYPVTAGSGQAGSRQTPNLRQGNFVLGFYKDGLDSQQPVIMGAIATNDNTILEGLDPEDGFMPRTGTDGLSGPIPVAAKDQLLSPNGSDKPVREGTSVSIAAISDPMQALAGNETTALPVADKNKENELDTVQIIIKNLLAVINRVRASSSSFFGASTAPFRIIKSEINKVINLVASFIKSLIQKIRGTVITALNNTVKDFVYFLFPNQRPELEQIQVQATDTIGCVFNKIIDGLVALVKGFLEEFIQNNVNAPLCAVEGAVGKLLDNGLADVADALNSVLGPIQGVFAGIEAAANVGGGLSGGIGGIIDQIAAVLQFLSCDETQQHPKIKEWSPWAGIKATTPLSSPLTNLIAGVNLGGAAPACNVGPSLAAPPALVAIGGNALVDAVFNPIVSAAGEIIAVDIVNPGVGYQAAPTIVVTATNDQGVIGGGAVLQPVLQNGTVTDVVVKESGSGFLPASNGTTVGAGNVVFSTPEQTVVLSKPPGPRISGGTTLNSSFSVPSGASIPPGTFIPSGTTLPTDLVLPEGSGGTPFFVDNGESGLNQTQRVLEGEAGFEALGVGGVGGDQANVNGLPAFLGGSGTPISGGLGGLFDSPNEELVLDPETGEEIDPGPETPQGLNSNQNLLSVGGTGGKNLTVGGSGGRRASINGSPISVGGKGGTILTVGGPGGTPVTAGAQPVTLGAVGGAPVKVGATGGRVITANRQPVTVGATGGKVVTAASRTNARKIATISKTPIKNPETGQFEITDETPITIGGTGGIPLTVGADGADPVSIGGFSITTNSSTGRPLSSGGSSLTVARKEVILTEGTTLTEGLIVPFGNFIPEGSIISSGTTIPFDIELTTILDLPKQLIDAIQAEPFSNSLEPGDVDGLLEFGYNAYSPNKTVRVKPGDQISAPFGTTSEILDNLGNVIDTIIGKGQTVPITVKNAGNYTTPEPILETDNKKIIGEEPSDGLGRYPAVLAIKDVTVLNNGINYSNTDEIVVTPDNGAKLEPVFDNFGKLIDVNVIDGGLGFKEMPKVIVKSKTGINAKIVPVFDVIRLGEDVDESFNVPAGTPIVKVIDCVGQVT